MAAVTEPSWPGKRTLARVRAPRHPQPQRAKAAIMRAQRTANKPRCSYAYSALGSLMLWNISRAA
jgi:hypothetical protein